MSYNTEVERCTSSQENGSESSGIGTLTPRALWKNGTGSLERLGGKNSPMFEQFIHLPTL
jgi:hypothetical protein